MTEQTARPVVVTFVHHPADDRAQRLVETAAALAEGLGVERAGIYMRVPVRVRTEPLEPSRLRPIRREAELVDVVVYCESHWIGLDPAPFHRLLREVEAEFSDQPSLLFVPVFLDAGALPTRLGVRNGIRWYEWKLDESRCRARALTRIVASIRDRIDGRNDDEGRRRRSAIFVSHAKMDGKDAAEALVRHVGEPANQIGLKTFYDALDLRDGEDFEVGLEEGVRDSALLALVSDGYEGRVWCNREILAAKRHRRPALIVDVGRQRVTRTYPYLGNLPFRRHDLATPEGCDLVLLDLAVEMLRVEVFLRMAQRIAPEALALPRPPELLDIAGLGPTETRAMIYPDPPLPDPELELLRRAAPGITFRTLEESAP